MHYRMSTNTDLLDLSVNRVATSLQHPAIAAREPDAQRYGSLARLRRVLASWKQRHRTRRQLANAGPEVLKDVGVSESQRFIEASKPFWEA